MKRQTCITLAIILLGLACSAGFFLFPRQLPLEECSADYLRYMDVDGVNVSFTKDFPVSDTLAVDVVTLQATDSAGWEMLKKDFHALPIPEASQKDIEKGIDIVTIHLAPKKDPTLPMDTTVLLNNNVVAISRLHLTVSIFNVTTKAEMDAVRASQYELGLP